MHPIRCFVAFCWFIAAFVVLYVVTTPLVNYYYDSRVAAGEAIYPNQVGFKWLLIIAALSLIVFVAGLKGKLPFTKREE